MKQVLTLIILSLFISTAKGEYISYLIKFEIVNLIGERFTAYTSGDEKYFNTDSLNNTNYLMHSLDMNYQHLDKKDTLIYFSERLQYKYQYVGDSLGSINIIYYLSDLQSIAEKDISSIRILEIEEDKIYEAISSPLTASDTLWTKKTPVSSYSFGAYLCIHNIYVHEESERVKKVLGLLEEKQTQIRNIRISYENGDKLDQEFWNIIPELHGEKVVIITECTD